MAFAHKDVPEEIEPRETEYGREWLLPSPMDQYGLIVVTSIAEVLRGRNIAAASNVDDRVYVLEGKDTHVLKKNEPTWFETAEVASDGGGVLHIARRKSTGELKKERHGPGETFQTVSLYGFGQAYALYAPEEAALVKITSKQIMFGPRPELALPGESRPELAVLRSKSRW